MFQIENSHQLIYETIFCLPIPYSIYYSAEEAIEKYQYFVGRTHNHMLPVYCEVRIIPVDKKQRNAKLMR